MSAGRGLDQLRETRHRYSLDGIALLDRDCLCGQSLQAIPDVGVSHCDPLRIRRRGGRRHSGTLRQCCHRNSCYEKYL